MLQDIEDFVNHHTFTPTPNPDASGKDFGVGVYRRGFLV